MVRSAEYADANAPGCLGVLALVAGITATWMLVAWLIG